MVMVVVVMIPAKKAMALVVIRPQELMMLSRLRSLHVIRGDYSFFVLLKFKVFFLPPPFMPPPMGCLPRGPFFCL